MAATVLIVDDSSAVRALLAGILRGLGLDVLQAANGEDALGVLEMTPKVEAILLDWRMKPVDGLEFLRRIRQDPRWRRVKVVMVTAQGEAESVRQAAGLGISGYIVKPFDRNLVAERIAALRIGEPADPGQALEPRRP